MIEIFRGKNGERKVRGWNGVYEFICGFMKLCGFSVFDDNVLVLLLMEGILHQLIW